MFLLLFLLLGILFGLLSGGSFARLARIPFRYAWLVPLAFLLQILIFSSSFEVWRGDITPWLYLLSILLLILAVALNLSLPGMKLLGLGLLLNLLVIMANGGRMPASLEGLAQAGLVERAEAIRAVGSSSNLVALTGETRLPFLADIFFLPPWFPLRNVFSLGDVLIGLGAFFFIWQGMREKISSKAQKCIDKTT